MKAPSLSNDNTTVIAGDSLIMCLNIQILNILLNIKYFNKNLIY